MAFYLQGTKVIDDTGNPILDGFDSVANIAATEVKITTGSDTAGDNTGLSVAAGMHNTWAYTIRQYNSSAGRAVWWTYNFIESFGGVGTVFGRGGVATRSGIIAVGDPNYDGSGTARGQIRLSVGSNNQNFLAETNIGPATAVDYSYFGIKLAMGCGKLAAGTISGINNTPTKVCIFDLDRTQPAGGSQSKNRYTVQTSNEIIIQDPSGSTGSSTGFGRYGLSLNHARLAVGDPLYDSGSFNNSGIVYIFDMYGNYLFPIEPSDPGNSGYFGSSIAIGCGKIVVGSEGGSLREGAVYIYDLDGSNEIKITASDGATNTYFGHSVDVRNNKILVGAQGDSSSRGAVYLYDLDGSNEIKIVGSDTDAGDQFGASVAIGSSKIYVGCPNVLVNLEARGAVYEYEIGSTIDTMYEDWLEVLY